MLLRVENPKVHYDVGEGRVRAVDGVSLSMERGEVLGVVGESGCGKSSLAMALLRLLPSNARVEGRGPFDGVRLPGERLRREIGGGAPR